MDACTQIAGYMALLKSTIYVAWKLRRIGKHLACARRSSEILGLRVIIKKPLMGVNCPLPAARPLWTNQPYARTMPPTPASDGGRRRLDEPIGAA